jgi:hypothetical protein
VQWTPTILVVDADGVERHRIEGLLPVDDFLSQLALGSAHAAFKRADYAAAERLFRQTLERFPKTDAAAEALLGGGLEVPPHQRCGDARGDGGGIRQPVPRVDLGEEGERVGVVDLQLLI